jgi:branched-chain amino acid transport system substrate-binding protein
MNQRKTYLLRIVIIGAVFLLPGCGKKTGETREQSTTIEIGATLPLTGNTAYLGEFCKNAIELAVQNVNAAGGVKGRKLVVDYGDSNNDPKEGVSLFNKMLLKKPPVVISAMNGVTSALAPSLVTETLNQISLTAAAKKMAVLLVEQNVEEARRMANHQLRLELGVVESTQMAPI